jgi:uncharacterized protein YqjF (DUF2071 family)
MDRIGPTYRPAGPPVGYQRWRHLLFLHWPVPSELLRPLVPAPFSIDVHDGVAYVGLVPFAMIGVRPRWAPERTAFRFLETNVRTYVHVGGRDPGVYFFSLDAASRVAVQIARARWGLPYFQARMRLARRGGALEYQSQRLTGSRPRLHVRCEVGEPLGPAAPATLEHFLLERYLLHVEWRGALWRGQVHHAPYPVHRARVRELHDELVAAAGLPMPADSPPLVHYAPGVDVEIFPLRRTSPPAPTRPRRGEGCPG